MVSHGSAFPFNSVCEEGTPETEQNVHFSSHSQASESALAKLSSALLISRSNAHHSVAVFYDLSAASDAPTAPACPPPQLPGLHSPSLSLTINGL